MFRRIMGLLFLCLSACDTGKPAVSDAVAAGVPGSCTFSQTRGDGGFFGPEYPAVDEYDCAVLDKMDCKLHAVGTQIEMRCSEISSANLQGLPSGCSHLGGSGYSGVTHDFITGGLLFVSAYQCPAISSMACHYYRHPGDACDDSNISPLDDCVANQDDEAHEDLRCVQ